ncbi:unnamed protein product [Rhizoctonia solani]|uniref:Uncharacterized protein n=1 Tax=Rhizoctonia solani TaxID=456999 RepID=A0A8H3CKM9_9AGAM|nr:unnamed protein product [Rhizoctonia solani]
MSNSQPAAAKKTKRPRGLLASRKATNHQDESEHVAKKPRGEDATTQDPEEIKTQDWQDLDELYENVLDAFYGPNWTSAIPLIRGVLHECARLVSVYKDPTLIYSPLEEEASASVEKTPASAFFTIYASAWLLMSTFARSDLSLLTEDEPKDPLEYILSALAACEKGQQALDVRNQSKAWDLDFIWGRALVAAAHSLSDSEDEPLTSENETTNARTHFLGPDSSTALGRAFEHLNFATKHRSQPTGSGNEITDEKQPKDERFVRALLATTQGVLAASESLQSGDSSVRYLEESRGLIRCAGGLSIPLELQIQVTLVLGQVELAIGSAIAERLEDDSDSEEAKSEKDESENREVAIKSLKEAIANFDAVRELYTEKPDRKGISVAEELKPMLQEALVTLATLLPEGPEQESMYSRYQAEGGVLDDEDEVE